MSQRVAEGEHRDGQRRRTGLPGGDASLALYTHPPRTVSLTTTIESRYLLQETRRTELVTGQRPLITEGVFTRMEADAGNHAFPP